MKTKSKKMQATLIVAVLLALIVAIFAMAGTTYAKYISTDSTQAKQATVAKWGYVVTVDADNLFSKKYDYDTTSDVSKYTTSTSTSISVNADSSHTDNDNIVAPGTTGSMTFSVTGNAEVLSKVTITASGTDVSLTKAATKTGDSETAGFEYYPIKWTLKSSSNGSSYTAVSGCEGTTLATIVSTINGLSINTTYDANSTALSNYYELSWAWNFENSDKIANSELTGNEADTILGRIIADSDLIADEVTDQEDTSKNKPAGIYNAYKNSVTSVKFSLSITVEQIQAVKS